MVGKYHYGQTVENMHQRFKGKRFLRSSDVADYLLVTPRTVHNLIKRKKLFALKVGKQYRIPVEGLVAYIKSVYKGA